jgi:hypothetical protein
LAFGQARPVPPQRGQRLPSRTLRGPRLPGGYLRCGPLWPFGIVQNAVPMPLAPVRISRPHSSTPALRSVTRPPRCRRGSSAGRAARWPRHRMLPAGRAGEDTPEGASAATASAIGSFASTVRSCDHAPAFPTDFDNASQPPEPEHAPARRRRCERSDLRQPPRRRPVPHADAEALQSLAARRRPDEPRAVVLRVLSAEDERRNAVTSSRQETTPPRVRWALASSMRP